MNKWTNEMYHHREYTKLHQHHMVGPSSNVLSTICAIGAHSRLRHSRQIQNSKHIYLDMQWNLECSQVYFRFRPNGMRANFMHFLSVCLCFVKSQKRSGKFYGFCTYRAHHCSLVHRTERLLYSGECDCGNLVEKTKFNLALCQLFIRHFSFVPVSAKMVQLIHYTKQSLYYIETMDETQRPFLVNFLRNITIKGREALRNPIEKCFDAMMEIVSKLIFRAIGSVQAFCFSCWCGPSSEADKNRFSPFSLFLVLSAYDRHPTWTINK